MSTNSVHTNELLDGLTAPNRKRIQRELVQVPLAIGHVVYEPNRRPLHVYFPETLVLSFVVRLHNGPSIEAAMTGYEGMAGIAALSVSGSASTVCVCQVPGDAQRLTVVAFRRLLKTMPQFGELLYRYAAAFVDQVSQTAACNRHHSVSERCARWLLMTHDRTHEAATFSLTQAFLANMLGIRREAVSDAASSFRRDKLIAYSRGRLAILDRRGLEEVSCECYRVVERRMHRLYV